MGVINHTKFQIVCDRCVGSEILNFDPTDTNHSQLLDKTGWQFWGRVGFGTNQRLLCPKCCKLLRRFLLNEIDSAVVETNA